MTKSLIIDYSFDYKRIALLEDGELTEFIFESKDDISPNNIYIAKVQKILKNKFVFVNLPNEQVGFLCLTDPAEKHLYDSNTQKIRIKQGEKILVQVKKQGTQQKASLVTSNISIIGKNFILTLNDENIKVSKKIKDLKPKQELQKLVQDLLPKGYGAVIRTNSKNSNILSLKKEIDYLLKKAKEIQDTSNKLKVPSLVYSSNYEVYNIINNLFSDNDKIYLNDKAEYEKLKDNVDFKNVYLYEESLPIFENFYVENQINEALNNKIWLKGGGFIVINQVEAMTIIDVNSGKNINKNRENMIFNTNLDALKEAFKQIRLRNISGIVIIDFIDMLDTQNYDFIYELAQKLALKDRVDINIFPMTQLGLLQLTRKKTRNAIHNIFMCNCPACGGLGLVKNEKYIALEIKNKLLTLFNSTNFTNFKVESNKRVIDALNNTDIVQLQKQYNKNLEIKSIQTIKLDYYKIYKN